jgi:hypothetical protein
MRGGAVIDAPRPLAQNRILCYYIGMANVLRQRFCFVILMASVALAVAFAEFFIFANFEHDCIGAHCSICLQIEVVPRLLESLAGVCITAALVFYAHSLLKLIVWYPAQLTPVALKVRCNF